MLVLDCYVLCKHLDLIGESKKMVCCLNRVKNWLSQEANVGIIVVRVLQDG